MSPVGYGNGEKPQKLLKMKKTPQNKCIQNKKTTPKKARPKPTDLIVTCAYILHLPGTVLM